MALPAHSTSLVSTMHLGTDGNSQVTRRTPAEYHPSVWGDHFLTFPHEQTKLNRWTGRVQELKEEVIGMLSNAGDTKQELDLINVLECLGVAYLFEQEIEKALHQIYRSHSTADANDLHTTALRFRLLRQHGYNIPSDVFTQFKDDNGNFKEALSTDVRGLLSLYEAAFLGTRGEDVLEEAIPFTRQHLSSSVDHLHPLLARKVSHALELPLHKRVQRLEHKYYISIYQEEEKRNETLLELAKLDFNLVQSLHQRELEELTRWWVELDLTGKLPFARDRLVELYFWANGTYFEPQYSRARVLMTKVLASISAMDDTYDGYGTMDELVQLTNAVERWDLEVANELPHYLQVCYLALFDTVKEIEEELAPQGKAYRIPYLKEGLKGLARAYFTEADWYSKGYVPPVEEYLDVAMVSCTYPMITILAFVGMDEIATEEAFEWAVKRPKIAMDASVICRLLDDIESNKFEQNRGHVASAIQCYINQHGSSEKEAYNELREMVTVAWKDINQAYLEQPVSPTLLTRVVNLARVIEILYQFGDGYTVSDRETKERIRSLLVDPIPLQD